MLQHINRLHIINPVTLLVFGLLSFVFLTGHSQVQAACSTPSGAYGVIDIPSVVVPTSGTYRLWVRMNAPDATNNAISVDVSNGNDSYCGIKVGDNSLMATNSWQWVNYQNGTSTSYVDLALNTAGTGNTSYQVVVTGLEPDVGVDRILLVSDLSCIPTSIDGSECLVDTTPPTITLTSPALSGDVTGSTILSATASDGRGMGKVDFYAGSTLLASDSTFPYSYTWDTTKIANATYAITARAYDTSSNSTTTGSVSLKVVNPPNVNVISPLAGATVKGTVTVSANASSLGGISRVDFYHGSTLFGTSSTSVYSTSLDTTKLADGTYTITAKAYDTGGLNASASVSVSILNSITPVTFTVSEDSFTKDGSYANKNLDKLNRIRISDVAGCTKKNCSTNFNRKGYLKFAVTGIKALPKSIMLRLYVSDSSDDGGKVYKIENNTWTENTLTWNNAPAMSTTAIGTVGAIQAGNFIDVALDPAAITKDGTYSFGIDNLSANMAGYYSFETGSAATLTLKF